ncbi:MAG: hypothetical protein HON70_19715, partial [Lentisphaerae bacterium]|nr:hypothetical protein [Lentisphaerota bacterium]
MWIRKLVLFAVVPACLSMAAELELQPFRYHEGFEGVTPEVTRWASNGESVVNAIVASEEQAFEGTHSLKIDVSLEGGSYHYWGVPVPVPCEGRLRMTARVLVAPGSTASVGFGTNMLYPPSSHSGCAPVKRFSKPTDGWQLVEADLVEIGAGGKARVLAQHTVNVSGEDAGATLDRWALFVYGGKGKRAVVYVDDIRIEGDVPSNKAYEFALAERFAAAQARFRKRLAGWRADLEAVSGRVKAMAEPPDLLADEAEAIRTSVVDARKLIAKLEKDGYAGQRDIDRLQGALGAGRHGPDILARVAAGAAAGKDIVVFAPKRAITNNWQGEGMPISHPIANALSASGCPGEYEPVVACIYALKDLRDVRVDVSELRNGGSVIPVEAVDVSVVKWWYQGAGGIGFSPDKVLKPELLLKDDRLVRVEHGTRDNFLRSTSEDGRESYLLCSGKTSEALAGVRPVDAPTLLPFDVPAKGRKLVWVTVRIPDETAPGTYSGTVSFRCGAVASTMPLRVSVHPFKLLPSCLTYSIYYRARLAKDDVPTIGSEYKSEKQYRAEIADMKAHGVLHPTNYQAWDEVYLPRVLEIRRDLGMPTDIFYNLGQGTGSTADAGELRRLQERVRRWVSLCRGFGYRDIYFYGIDEAKGDRLAAQRLTWKAVQDAGGKTFVACYHKTFEAMGNLLDCAVLAGPPDPKEGAKWHSVGSEALCYANPQVGVEEAEVYRRNFGLVLWQAGFDGAMDYAYQHGFGHVWNDFDSPRYRDHNFTYPTVDGIVDTLAWEGFREGVDDVRYVTTLEQAISHASGRKRALADQAQLWLKKLDGKSADLYATRAAMAEWIV